MRKKISFLVGSGFSIPEGLPGVSDLNKRLSKIDESEILIHTDQTAIFLNGQVDNNRWSRSEERLFLQEFLEFYNSNILKKEEHFHYETFYDFYSGYLTKKENEETIEEFCYNFCEKHELKQNSSLGYHNMVSDFNRTFNQLLASQLQKSKYFNDYSTSGYPPYDTFIRFLIRILDICDIKFHSLNHDLFFDWLGQKHTYLWQHFTDGFQLENSPFYGTFNHVFNPSTDKEVNKTYYVKLERFVDKFDKPLSLFKLHGSISNTLIYTPGSKQEIVRLKDDYGIYQFYMEFQDEETGKYSFKHLWNEAAPDFLSGSTNKTRFYTGDPYYKKLFNYFKQNLLESEKLIVIGYGFKDNGINDYIENNFLVHGKTMIVIDPFKPQSELFEKYNVSYINASVINAPYDDIVKMLNK